MKEQVLSFHKVLEFRGSKTLEGSNEFCLPNVSLNILASINRVAKNGLGSHLAPGHP